MENVNRWYFTKDQLANTPSKKDDIDSNKELSYRQQASHFIQDMGQRLQVSQLCINTAIVYMHRFFAFHSFLDVHRNSISVAALFLAAKVEEQPRKLEHVIKIAHICLHKNNPHLDVKTDAYAVKQLEVVAHENVLLQTLGFVLAIEHPHTYVVKVCQLVKASKDLAQTSYFMATTSLHMTTMCLQYKPTVVACVCIHLACKWSNWKIEPCSEGKEWYYYVDKSVTLDLLETLTKEFIAIMETSPHNIKRRFISHKDGGYHGPKNILDEVTGSGKHFSENKIGIAKKDYSSPGTSSSISINFNDFDDKPSDSDTSEKNSISSAQTSPSKKVTQEKNTSSHSISLDVYREKREKERQTERKSALSIVTDDSIKESSLKSMKTEKVTPAPTERDRQPHPTHSAKHIEHGSTSSKEKSSKVNDIKKGMFVVKSLLNHERSPEKNSCKLLKLSNAEVKSASNCEVKNPSNIDGKSSSNVEVVNSSNIEVKNSIKVEPKSSFNSELKGLLNLEGKNSKISKGNSDPFVLLTRVDEQQHTGKIALPPSESQILEKKNLTLPSSSNVLDEKHNKFKFLKHKISTLDNSSEIFCDIKTSLRTPETNSTAKSKHQKHKVNLLHNNHSSTQQITQGDPLKLSPILDTIKANGSKEVNAVDNRLHNAVENNIDFVKNSDSSSSKHEKREKHRHKHSSSREKTANHLIGPVADVPLSGGGIKITIPKDKICLSGARSESSQKSHSSGRSESPKKSLKIKIPKPPIKEVPKPVAKPSLSGSGLKLVLTKDKSGSGSYSTSHKSERESRKRPMNQSHTNQDRLKNSYDHKPGKVPKLDPALYKSHHLDGVNAVSSKQLKMARHNALHGISEQVGGGKLQPQMNDGAQHNFVIPYGQSYYPQMYPYSNAPPPPLPHGHLPSSIKTNSLPPLPPPLPPQPPPPPE